MQSKKEVQVFPAFSLCTSPRTEVFPGNSVGLRLHNLLPGLTSLISEKIPIELENLRAEHVHLFLHLIPSHSGLSTALGAMTTAGGASSPSAFLVSVLIFLVKVHPILSTCRLVGSWLPSLL